MSPAPSEVPMRCGGCGGKVGGTILSRALSRVGAQAGADVVLGLDAREDVSEVKVPPGKTLIQSVDFFRTFIDDPFVFARITTNHCLNDIYAKGAEPHSALATVTVPFGPGEKVEEELAQLLSGAVAELRRHNAVLLGGHSAEGAELGLGLTVNAFANPETLLRKNALQPGQALILTKALGTGCLFAADMRRQAKGQWIEEAIQSMLLPAGEAAQCLRRHGATACTDVTGFGLLGHLLEMLATSRVSAEISLGAIPVLSGATECIRAGIVSSIHPENLRFRQALQKPDQPPSILFDPQTAGGLLAGIPFTHVESCLADLKGLGHASARLIGEIMPVQGVSKVSIAP